MPSRERHRALDLGITPASPLRHNDSVSSFRGRLRIYVMVDGDTAEPWHRPPWWLTSGRGRDPRVVVARRVLSVSPCGTTLLVERRRRSPTRLPGHRPAPSRGRVWGHVVAVRVCGRRM